MPRNPDKATMVLEQLRKQFESTPYILEQKFDEPDKITDTKDDILLSVVVPARNEFPQIVMTIYSLWHCWQTDGYDASQIEIIIVNNCSTEWTKENWDWSKPGDKGTTEYLMARGAYWARKVRVHFDPIAGNHSARNKGASLARGKYLFFSDAHMAYSPGFFKHMIATIEQTGGLFHGTIAWMGAYPPSASGTGCGYTLKLGEEIKGTWNNYQLSPDHFFFIPALGHCSVGVLREQFLNFGGYPSVHRSYGGGEFYLNMKWWMFGSSVSTHPQAIGYHLASSRGYSWTHNDYVHNVLNIGYALGMDDWLERAYLNWLRHNRQEEMERMMEEAKVEMQLDREFIEKKRVMTFNELLVKRPWKQKNVDMLGHGLDNILIFHDTWEDLIQGSPKVKKMYEASETQKKLAQFIEENLCQFIYKPHKR